MYILFGSGTFDLQKGGRLLNVDNKDTRPEDIRFTTLVIAPAEQEPNSKPLMYNDVQTHHTVLRALYITFIVIIMSISKFNIMQQSIFVTYIYK